MTGIDFTAMFDLEKIGVANNAKLKPDKPALITEAEVITFSQLEARTNSLANGLLDLGVKAGERIAVLMHNSSGILETLAAVGKIGVTPIALSYRFKKGEISHIINDSESKVLMYGQEFESVVQETMPLIDVSDITLIQAGGTPSPGVLSWEDILEKGNPHPPKMDPGSVGVSSVLIYTSGTTGRPKGVFKNSKNRLNTLLGYAHLFESEYGDVHLVPAPLYHSAPYAFATVSLFLGGTVVIMPKFDSEKFLSLIEKYRVNSTFVVPTILNRITNLPEEILGKYDLSSMRVITMGGESCPFQVKEKTLKLFPGRRFFEFYGGTETAVVTILQPEHQLSKPGSCGKPVMGAEFKLLDENKNEVPQGEVGILYVKSDFLLDYYYRNPEATEANYHDGFFTIGDMARMDEEGFYYIEDRAVDMILSGGMNIYPAEIEDTLCTHPQIFDASIIGVPDPDWGEKIIGFVVLKEKDSLSQEDIINYVKENLASYKKPKEVIFLDEIPYSPSGKQLKRVLKQEYIRDKLG